MDVEIRVDGISDVIAELQKLCKDMSGMVKAGVIETSENYEEVIQYAPVQEFGAKIPVTDKMRAFLAVNYGIFLSKKKKFITVPPRSFMRTTYDKHVEEWFEQIAKDLEAGADGKLVMKRIGRRMVDDIVDTIMSNMPPPLTKMTKIIESQRERGPGNIDRTLYESGHMAHSINHEVFPDAKPT